MPRATVHLLLAGCTLSLLVLLGWAIDRESPTGPTTASPRVGQNEDAQEAEVASWQLTQRLEHAGVFGDRLAISPDGEHWAVTWHRSYTLVRDADVETRGDLAFTGTPRFSADGSRLWLGGGTLELGGEVSAAPDPQPALWSGLTDRPSRTARFSITGAAVSRDLTRAALSARYRPPRGLDAENDFSGPAFRLLLVEVATSNLVCVLFEDSLEDYNAIDVSDDLVAAGYLDVRVWRRGTCEPIAELEAHQYRVTQLAFSPDGQHLASVGRDHRICLWTVGDWGSPACWEGHENDVLSLAFHPREPVLATGDGDGTIHLWALGGGDAPLATFAAGGQVNALAFAPEGDSLYVALGGRGARTRVLSVTPPQ